MRKLETVCVRVFFSKLTHLCVDRILSNVLYTATEKEPEEKPYLSLIFNVFLRKSSEFLMYINYLYVLENILKILLHGMFPLFNKIYF